MAKHQKPLRLAADQVAPVVAAAAEIERLAASTLLLPFCNANIPAVAAAVRIVAAAGQRRRQVLAGWAARQLLSWAAAASTVVYWGHWDCPSAAVAADWAPLVAAVAAEAFGWAPYCSWQAAVVVQHLCPQR